jgi:hypothetical protein
VCVCVCVCVCTCVCVYVCVWVPSYLPQVCSLALPLWYVLSVGISHHLAPGGSIQKVIRAGLILCTLVPLVLSAHTHTQDIYKQIHTHSHKGFLSFVFCVCDIQKTYPNRFTHTHTRASYLSFLFFPFLSLLLTYSHTLS